MPDSISNSISDHFCDREILLVRHGRTEWNETHRFQGRTDIPLNDTGFLQAEKTARRLAAWPMDVLYTSPMTRARQTADAIAAPHRKTPVVLDGLVETDFGVWESRYYEKVGKEESELMRAWLDDPFFHVPERAETWEAIRARVEGAMEIVFRSDYRRVAIVSHGGVMRALFAILLKLDPHTVWNLRTSNCGLSGIEVRKRQTSLVFSNDELHLKEGLEGLPLPVW
jgi:broad specificity phosphatase PhoE